MSGYDFPVFDHQRRCPKCGGDANVKYNGRLQGTFDFTVPDTITRRCSRCDHSWYEWPLDRAEAPA